MFPACPAGFSEGAEMNVKKDKFEHWSAEDSATLYGINDWGAEIGRAHV